ncbi:hypothetical protein [Gordonia rubripertincta]|uniref:hypothetical protein n=1 Tax=Gordonia rubripertincta TaxID=36822 RepID=UPI0015FD908A|nr:hypothetical protein [Gordonia rubripertincta]QMU20124.1 hypothetical protein H3V45_19080 [Gordonia rubripertincta]
MTTGQEMWLDPGPPLPRRTWQRKTRVPVIVGTTIAMVLFAALAIGALLLGVLRTPTLTAKGGVVADCVTEVASLPGGGQIARETPVFIYDAAGGEVSKTSLTGFLRSDTGCQLTFEIDGVEYTDAGYVVRVGESFSQTVSTAALQKGAVLRPLG